MEKRYIAYYRVSTAKQGQSGLGLAAQRSTVESFIHHNGNTLIGEFTEIESGKNDRRPELIKAIRLAMENDATLVISKLDRLSRNLSFISNLMDSRVKFVACDIPEANELTISIFASIAQFERKRISERITEALSAKKKREPLWKPGTNNFTEKGTKKGLETIKRNARSDKAVRHAYHFMKPMIEQGCSYQRIAEALNVEGYTTRGGCSFHPSQVRAIWKRFESV